MKQVILTAISLFIIVSTAFGCGDSEEAAYPTATFAAAPATTSAFSPGSTLALTGKELLEQAREMQTDGDYEGAIESYQAFIDGGYYVSEAGEYFSSYEAGNAIGALYKAWAEELESQEQHDEGQKIAPDRSR